MLDWDRLSTAAPHHPRVREEIRKNRKQSQLLNYNRKYVSLSNGSVTNIRETLMKHLVRPGHILLNDYIKRLIIMNGIIKSEKKSKLSF